jgi:thymidylate synthase
MIYSFEYEYLDLLYDTLATGTEKKDRTGIGTKSIFGANMHIDMSDGFPLVTTKKVYWKGIVHELLWFLSGDTNIKYLQDNNVRIWDEWADKNGDLGSVYGKQWRNFGGVDQIQWLVDELKTNPDSRRLLLSAWNPGELDQMALPPCHYGFQLYSEEIGSKRSLSMSLQMRSCDSFLGTPFNIASYALLLHMFAHVTDHEVGTLIFNGGDFHIYNNHVEQVQEQLQRDPYELPAIKLNKDIDNIFDFTYDDIELVGYKCHPAIKAPVAV